MGPGVVADIGVGFSGLEGWTHLSGPVWTCYRSYGTTLGKAEHWSAGGASGVRGRRVGALSTEVHVGYMEGCVGPRPGRDANSWKRYNCTTTLGSRNISTLVIPRESKQERADVRENGLRARPPRLDILAVLWIDFAL